MSDRLYHTRSGEGIAQSKRGDKWRIRRLDHRWWLLRPDTEPRSWIAECVGTFAQCVSALDRALKRY